MNESLLAGRYAKALLAYAEEVGEADALYPLMGRLEGVLRHESKEREVVDNPTLAESLRGDYVVSLVGGEEPPRSLRRFVDLVFCHNRERLLGEMARAYIRLYRRHRGIVHARLVATATPTQEEVERLKELIRQRRDGVVELEVVVDREILGGFILRVEGRVLDGSAKGAIERIRQQFIVRNRNIV